MPVTFPHIFHDGPGNLASGVQVMENLEALAAAISGFTAAQSQTDLFQPGVVVSTDWSFVATINPATAGLGSEAATGGSAWTFTEAGGLVRTFTPTAKLEGLVPTKPAAGKYVTVGFELKAAEEGAIVTVVSGVAQASQALAEANSPAVSANHIRIRDVVVLNTAGVYSIVSQTDRRTNALKVGEPGDLKFSAAATVQFGFLKCEGQEVSRTIYAALWKYLGEGASPFGLGNGTTTFNLPDYRERVAMGPGGTNGVGKKLGEATHTLTAGEIASHTHSITDPGHAHAVTDPTHAHAVTDPTHAHHEYPGYFLNAAGVGEVLNFGTSGGTFPLHYSASETNTFAGGTGVSINGAATGVSVSSASTGIAATNANAGAGGAHNNVQPSTVCNVWIRF